MNAIGDVVFNENVKTTFYYKVESQSEVNCKFKCDSL